ncbi:DinB family protein [Mariniflexile gromovii]|uniref:DinB family protein n=1 Tax=Mariniflexile gromovii TaxID=362523 RepID=A0ABS4BWT4_9FLAO|nr:DinB family protein [Mariniflexile gromovii]MBP0905061.1 DinB family protein [Mariniflexile gromovii]
MNFNLNKSIEILERTPVTLHHLLYNISNEWTLKNEGYETWSVFDVIGHLIHGEKTDWIPRVKTILSNKPDKSFPLYDRNAQFIESKNKTIKQLLDEFVQLRKQNISYLISKKISETDLNSKGIHTVFGEVTLAQLIATWMVHDLNHIAQISRIMANQYKKEVGPWIEYLTILK